MTGRAVVEDGGAPGGDRRERIPIASDHAGVELKARLVEALERLGFQPDDMGPAGDAAVDYADYAHPLAGRVSRGDARRGILLCGTGLGMSYAANRHQGVRAAVAWSPEVAELSRRHNDANVLVLPARFLSGEEGERILHRWLDTPFEAGRHERRVEKIELHGEVDGRGVGVDDMGPAGGEGAAGRVSHQHS